MEADTHRLHAAIGWTPRVGFTEGMARTVAWARRQLAVEASRDRR